MLKVIVIGLGPIGINAACAVRQDPGMKLVGLVDLDSHKVGKSLDELTGGVKTVGSASATRLFPVVEPRLADALAGGPQVAIVTTASQFDQAAPTLRQCMQHRLHVASSCEEMSFPRFRHAELADEIDAESRRANVAMVGTGVNPGFVMDLLPLVLSSMVGQVSGVKVFRRLDASTRRKPLQAKVGATMMPEEFASLARQGKIGHMGIGESVAMLAAGLGRQAKPAEVNITLDPVIAGKELDSLMGKIRPGMVCGMRNTATWHADGLSIELDLTMAVGAPDPQDRVELSGPVPLTAIIPGGTPGDTATVASLVNCARLLPTVSPGLKTMLDLPPASCKRV